MDKPRVTEGRAGGLIESLVKTGDLIVFMSEFCYYSWLFGKYGPRSRELFCESIIKGLKQVIGKDLLDKIVSKIAEGEFEKWT